MIAEFNRLKSRYASQELTMEDLQTLQNSTLVSFTNHGISRTNRDCLLCDVHFDAFIRLKTTLTAQTFESVDVYCNYMESSELQLQRQESDADIIVYECDNVEIIAAVESDGVVRVDADDIEGVDRFEVFLRVQH